MSEPRSSSVEKIWLFIIIAIGLALRVAAVSNLNIAPTGDYEAYRSMAVNFLQGRGIIDFMGNYAMYNVGYPLFILAPVFFLFDNSIFAAQIVNALLGVFCIYLCYRIARTIGAGLYGRLFAATAWALYLPACVYAEYLAKENLMTPILLGITWSGLCFLKRGHITAAISTGLLFGLLALIGNAGLALLPVSILCLLFAPVNASKKITSFILAIVIAVTIITPWMIRNQNVLGKAVLNTNGGFNLYLGNNAAANGFYISIGDTPRGSTWEQLRKEGEIKASEILRNEAIEWIKQNPVTFISLAFKKAAYFWMPPIHETKEQVSSFESKVRLLWQIQFGIIVIAALGSLIFLSLRNRYTGVLWLSLAGYTAVHMIFYVIFRYREPIMPLACILAALSLEQLIMRFIKSSEYQPDSRVSS